MFGFDRRETIKLNKCAPSPIGCGKNVEEKDFANELEKKIRYFKFVSNVSKGIF